jgi:hypothetical protein
LQGKESLVVTSKHAKFRQYSIASATANMPSLDVSELNTVLSVLGAFILLYGIISVKIKSKWFLGEAREQTRIWNVFYQYT